MKKISCSVTRDSGANVKILKKLEKKGFIEIFDVLIENGRKNRKVPNKIIPIGVWGHTRWGEFIMTDNDSLFEDIKIIIGKNHIKDVIHLEAHIRNKHDYFITEDTDFLKKRDELNKKFNVVILTPIEIRDFFEN